MIRLVFNADDFGVSESVNRSILETLSGGLLKSVSLMMTHGAAEAAVEAADQLETPPGFGLHFCLTSGTAVSPPSQIPLLAEPNGRLKHGFLGLVKLLASSRRDEAAKQMGIEFRAQSEAFERLLSRTKRCTVDHLDSHQHIHVFPPLLRIFREEARRKELTLRIPTEPIAGLSRVGRPPFFFHAKGTAKKVILDHYIQKEKTHESSNDPIYFGVIDSGRMRTETIQAIIDRIPRLVRKTGRELYEINLHPWKVGNGEEPIPASASDADKAFGTSAERELEYNALIKNAPQIRKRMSDLGITASYFGTPAQNR